MKKFLSNLLLKISQKLDAENVRDKMQDDFNMLGWRVVIVKTIAGSEYIVARDGAMWKLAKANKK